jgi:hypothetical protein
MLHYRPQMLKPLRTGLVRLFASATGTLGQVVARAALKGQMILNVRSEFLLVAKCMRLILEVRGTVGEDRSRLTKFSN